MKMRDLVKAAKEYDIAHRPFGQIWTSVPDSQVARLILGAKLAIQESRAEAGTPDKKE